MRKSFCAPFIGIVVSTMVLVNLFTSLPAEAQPFVYVTVTSQDSDGQDTSHVSVINAATNTVVATVPVGRNPAEVAFTPDGTRAYVAIFAFPFTVSVIDTATNTVNGTIAVGDRPRGVAITPDGTRVYVTHQVLPPDAVADTVSVIDTATNTLIDTDPSTPEIDPIPVGFTPDGLAITPDGTRAYVANFGPASREPGGTVSVIDTDPISSTFNNVVASITADVGKNPRGVAITPDGTRVYVTYDTDTPITNAGPVNVIDNAAIPTVISPPIFEVGVDLIRIAITPDGTRAYVTNTSTCDCVRVIDTTTNALVGSPIKDPVGSDPTGIAITPDGTRAYVANAAFDQVDSGTVSVIDTDPSSASVNTVIATVQVGGNPFGVAISPVVKVAIDIKPDSDPNSIQLGSEGNVPVAIFSTPEFDATTVDPLTVTLASAPVKLKGNGTSQSSFEDVDGDGLLDQVVHVDTTALELSEEDEIAVLTGETNNGTPIRGKDTVRIVP